MEFKIGGSFRAVVPFSAPKSCKVHVDHILPSFYQDQKLIVYRIFGKRRQHWHEFIATDADMFWYIQRYERHRIHIEKQLNHVRMLSGLQPKT